MSTRRSFVRLTLAGLIAATSVSAASAADKDSAKAQVEAAHQEFYSALNALFKGDAAPMSEVWSHRKDVTYMGPSGGMQVGWKAVDANWKKQAAKKLGGKVMPEKVHYQIGKSLAVTVCFEVGENVVDGKTEKVSLRATNVFRKEKGEWKMIGHHTELLPFLSDSSTKTD